MTPDVVAVRQNLNLLVDGGQPVPGLNARTPRTGATRSATRSSVALRARCHCQRCPGVRGGPGLNITDLANLLVRAGAVRAMELDINTDWVDFSTYRPATPTGPASAANGTELLPTMTGTPARYFEPWWAAGLHHHVVSTGWLRCGPVTKRPRSSTTLS